MKTSSNKELSPSLTQTLTQMGGRIRQARLRRRITQGSLASQIDSTMVTIAKVEKGDPSVSLGTYAKVLEALQLQEGLDNIANNDKVVFEVLDAMIPRRVRKRKAESMRPTDLRYPLD